MRKGILVIGLFFFYGSMAAQPVENKLIDRMKSFHQLMISKRFYINQYVDDSLTYGHSNGWVESCSEFLSNLGRKMEYHSIKEDSVRVSVHQHIAHIRFVADIDVSMNGNRNTYHLKVLEVWVKRSKNWKIFARQAVR